MTKQEKAILKNKAKKVELSENNKTELGILADKMGFERDYNKMFEATSGRNVLDFINKQDYSLSWKEHKLYSAKRYYEVTGETKHKVRLKLLLNDLFANLQGLLLNQILQEK